MTRPATTRSTKKSAGEGGGGGTDDDDGSTTRSPIHRRRSSNGSSSSRWLLGLAVLLTVMNQAAAAAVVPPQSSTTTSTSTTTASPDSLIEDILSAVKTPLEEGWATTRNATRAPPRRHHQARAGGLEQFKNTTNGPIFGKRSDKTMKAFRKFADRNCRDIDDRTFIIWEQDQFAAHLKSAILPSSTRDAEDAAAERSRVRALLSQELDAADALSSKCKTNTGAFDESRYHENAANDFFENEIVNSVFANMYKRGVNGYRYRNTGLGLFYADKFKSITVERRRNSDGVMETRVPILHEDELLTKELFRTLKR